ncbi:hypothetical protein ACFP3I_04855 [Chryseobacterium arachidis]
MSNRWLPSLRAKKERQSTSVSGLPANFSSVKKGSTILFCIIIFVIFR